MKKLSLFLFALAMLLVSCKPDEMPTVVTKSVGKVTKNSAKVVGQVTVDGGADVSERGVCWNTEGAPEIIDFCTKDGSGVGIFTSTISNLESQTAYYVRAYATNEVGTSYGEEVSFTTLDRTFENGHEYVDLGLSVKWATCNVGANSPEEYGDYFAWGEIVTKDTYTMENCTTNGKTMGYIGGDAEYDVAASNWGGDWRIPTYDELDELRMQCTWVLTTQNGVDGYNVEGPNGNSIFLPAAGYREASSLYGTGSIGHYWTSISDVGYAHHDYSAYILGFHGFHYMTSAERSDGRSVRPVLE